MLPWIEQSSIRPAETRAWHAKNLTSLTNTRAHIFPSRVTPSFPGSIDPAIIAHELALPSDFQEK